MVSCGPRPALLWLLVPMLCLLAFDAFSSLFLSRDHRYFPRLLHPPVPAAMVRSLDHHNLPPVGLHSEPQGNKWEPKQVMLFTYARSGSSFTGDIIRHSPDVYYVFEPLHRCSKKNTFPTNSSHGKGKQEPLNPLDVVMSGLFRCDFSSPIFQRSLHMGFLKERTSGNETEQLGKCLQTLTSSAAPHACIRESESACRKHRRVVIKEFRYQLTSVENLMSSNPALAILYLVRDPRANFWSRMKGFHKPTRDTLQDFSRQYCSRILQDMAKMVDIFRRDQRKVRFVRYEDLARNPVDVSRNIYDFLQINWSSEVEAQIINQTSSGITDSRRIISFSRGSSERASNAWRESIPWSVSEVIEGECGAVLDALGYRTFHSQQELRNLSFRTTSDFKLLTQLSPPADLGDTGTVRGS